MFTLLEFLTTQTLTYKNFLHLWAQFLYFDFKDLILLSLLCLSLWGAVVTRSFRQKFFYFIATLFLLTSWGFLASLDVMVLMMLTTEFLVILLFLLVFASFSINTKQTRVPHFFLGLFILGAFGLFFFTLPYITSKEFTPYGFVYLYQLDVVSRDLFIYYYYFFVEEPFALIFLATILGLISVFFISVYFVLKLFQQKHVNTHRYYLILRKQAFMKQAKYTAPIVFFQK